MSGGHYPSYNNLPAKDFFGTRHRLPSIVPSVPSSYHSLTISSTENSNSSWMNKKSYPLNFSDNLSGFSQSAVQNHQPSWSTTLNQSDRVDSKPQMNTFLFEEQQESINKTSSQVTTSPSINGNMSIQSPRKSKSMNGAAQLNHSPKPVKEHSTCSNISNFAKTNNIATDKILSNSSGSLGSFESVLETMLRSDSKTSTSVLQPSKLDESVDKFLKLSPRPFIVSPEMSRRKSNSKTPDKNEKLKSKINNNLSASPSNKPECTTDKFEGFQLILNEKEVAPTITKMEEPVVESLNLKSTKQSIPNKSVENNEIITSGSPKKSNKKTKARTVETTYVQVESELEKMFEGVEDESCKKSSNTSQTLPSIKVEPTVNNSNNSASVHSADKPEPSTVTNPSPKKANKKRNSKNSKLNNKTSKNSKSKHSASVKENSMLDNATTKRVPVIHIEGSKKNPISVQIINSIKLEEEDSSDNKIASKRKSVKSDRANKRLATDYVVKNYDPGTSDSSWICIFCKLSAQTPWISGEPSGDLFGPYFIQEPTQPKRESRRSDHSDLLKKKQKRSMSVEKNYVDPSSSEPKSTEIWAHENCFVWASGLHLIGSKLIGLEEAVLDALNTTCTHCGEKGATITCKTRHCKNIVHYGCAVFNSWILDPDTFVTICNIHKTVK